MRAMLEFWIVLDLDMVSLNMMIDEGVRDSRVLEQMRVVRLGFWLLVCTARLEADGRKGSLTGYWPVLHDVVPGKCVPSVKERSHTTSLQGVASALCSTSYAL